MTSFTTHSCVSVKCGTCRESYGDGEWGGEIHFESTEAAAKQLSAQGWQVDSNSATCGSCLSLLACEREGHDWEGWRRCLCGCSVGAPTIRDHVAPTEVRHCERCCDAYEDRELSIEGGAAS